MAGEIDMVEARLSALRMCVHKFIGFGGSENKF